MTARQVWIGVAGLLIAGTFLVIVAMDPGCDYRDARSGACWVSRTTDAGTSVPLYGTDLRPMMFVLAGVAALFAIFLALSPWGRR